MEPIIKELEPWVENLGLAFDERDKYVSFPEFMAREQLEFRKSLPCATHTPSGAVIMACNGHISITTFDDQAGYHVTLSHEHGPDWPLEGVDDPSGEVLDGPE